MVMTFVISAALVLGSWHTAVTVECAEPFHVQFTLTNDSPESFRSAVDVSIDPRQWGLYRFSAFRISPELKPVDVYLASSATFLDELRMEAGEALSLEYSIAEWLGPDQVDASGLIIQWWVDPEVETMIGMNIDRGRAGFIHVPPRRIRWMESTRPCASAALLH